MSHPALRLIPSRRLATISAALLLAAALARSQTATPTGVGGGGFLWSGAFHPVDDDVVLIGGDNCGVFRSDDYGASWYLWSDGLYNADEANSFYVEDLLGLTWDVGAEDGFFAATRGGIYYRDTSGTTGWNRLTAGPAYHYRDYRVLGNPSLPCVTRVIPFSCLDHDGGTLLFAGAGHARFVDGAVQPEINLDACDPGTVSGVWFTSTTGPASAMNWIEFPFTKGAEFQNVRDISAETINGILYVAVATNTGVHFYSSAIAGWTLDASVNQDCWSVHITRWGTLYASFEAGGSIVQRVPDITGTVNWSTAWEILDSRNLIAPGCSATLAGFANMVYLTVFDAPTALGSDILYAGGNNSIGGLGLFRTELVGTAPLTQNLHWKRWVYRDDADRFYTKNDLASVCTDDSIGSTADLPLGYITEWDVPLTFHAVVSPNDPDRVLAQFNARLHVYDAPSDTWQQRYTYSSPFRSGSDPVSCPWDDSWMTTGYNQQSVRDIAFRKAPIGAGDTHVLVADADAAAFTSPLGTDEFTRRNPGLDSVYAWRACDVAYEKDSDAMFVVYGGEKKPGQIFRWHFTTCTWNGVTTGIGSVFGTSDDNMGFGDLLAVGDTLYAAYAEYQTSLLVTEASMNTLLAAGVMRGISADGGSTFSWAAWDTGLPGNTLIQAVRLLRKKDTGQILVTDKSGLFLSDSSAPTGAWTQIFPATGYTDYHDFRSIAQSKDGSVIYAGMRGRELLGIGGVLRLDSGTDPAVQSNWDLITFGNPFEFTNPYGESWANPGDVLTFVSALAVNPLDDQCVFAGLLNTTGAMEQEGLWVYNYHGSNAWNRYPADTPIRGLGVLALGFTGAGSIARTLYAGTAGHDLYRIPVYKQPATGGGGGSGCPTVYVFDGVEYRRDNTLLSAVGPGEAGRIDANVCDRYVLQAPIAEVDGTLRVQIREFESEHSYIDRVELVAVDHPADTRIVALDDGQLVAQREWALPVTASTAAGNDVLAAVTAWDNDEFTGRPGDSVDLTYRIPTSKSGIRILAVGDEKDPAGPTSGRQSTGIEALLRHPVSGEYVSLGSFIPREHAAPRALAVPADVTIGGELSIRLVWHARHGLDFAGMLIPLHVPVQPHDLPVAAAVHSAAPARVDALAGADGEFVELAPGQTLTLEFDAPRSTPATARSYVLVVDGHYTASDDDASTPRAFAAYPATPNPFNPTTTIRFDLPSSARVTVRVYDVTGRLVATVADRAFGAGQQRVLWDGRNDAGETLSSGVYFYRITSPFGTKTQKLVLLK
jgi:hypothetical protein